MTTGALCIGYDDINLSIYIPVCFSFIISKHATIIIMNRNLWFFETRETREINISFDDISYKFYIYIYIAIWDVKI